MKAPERHYASSYLALIGVVLLLALVGYSAYALYPRFALNTAVGSSLLLLASAAGLASLFSPCSFPLLVTLLAGETNGQAGGKVARSAAAFTAGVVLFLLLLGMAIGLGAGTIITRFTFTSPAGRGLRLVAGLVLIGFGFWQLRGRSLNAAWLNRVSQPLWDRQFRLRQRKTTLGYGLYGFGYVLAGFGWTGPILAGLAVHALAVGNATAALWAFTTAATTIAVVMAVLVTVLGLAQGRLVQASIRGMKGSTHFVKRLGGAILILVGVWLIVLAVWAAQFARIFPVWG